MKKTIHEEIITLQNYFKSMRAKMDVLGGEAGDRLLSLQVPCHLCDPPGTRRAGGPQTLLHEGLHGPTEKCSRTAKRGPKTTEKCSRTAKRGPKTASLGLRCRCSRGGLRLVPNLPDLGMGGMQLLLKTPGRTNSTARLWLVRKARSTAAARLFLSQFFYTYPCFQVALEHTAWPGLCQDAISWDKDKATTSTRTSQAEGEPPAAQGAA